MSILQQTDASDANMDDAPREALVVPSPSEGPNVLEDVIDKATAKSELEQEIHGKSRCGCRPEDVWLRMS